MVKAGNREALQRALDELRSRNKGGPIDFDEVCELAAVSRATAYRVPGFKEECDRTAATAQSVPAAAEKRSTYRERVDRLANQIQALALQLEAERKAASSRPSNVIALKGKPGRP